MAEPPFRLEFYADGSGDEPVRRWIREELTPTQRRAIGAAMHELLQHLGVGVCGTEFGQQLEGGLFEFRLRHDAQEVLRITGRLRSAQPRRKRSGERILLRVFCHAYGKRVILLLGGYDKGRHPSKRRQRREIETARGRLRDFKRRKPQGGKPPGGTRGAG